MSTETRKNRFAWQPGEATVSGPEGEKLVDLNAVFGNKEKPVKKTKGSVTMDENPEGINQYTGGGGAKKEPASVKQRLSEQAGKADLSTSKAIAASKAVKNADTHENHRAAAEAHRQALKEHTAAREAAKAAGNARAAGYHGTMKAQHSNQLTYHAKRA